LIKIVNNEEFPILQIDLQISVEEGDLSVDDIELKPKDEPKMESESGGIVMSHDVLGIGVITDEGKREDHIIIYDIDAHATKEFFANINAENSHQKSKILFQIVRTAKKPTDILSFDPFKSCESDKHDLKTYHETSKMMLNQKRYNEALVCCEKAIMKDPGFAKAHSNMGVAFLFLNETDKAIRKFEDAISINPELPAPYLNLAGILFQQGKFQDAIERLKVVSNFNGPEKPDALVLWGRCLAIQNNFESATEKYKDAIELDPEFGPAYYWWGLLLKGKNDCEKAIEKFQKATEYKHAYRLDSYGMWGACLEKINKYQDAIDKYQKIIDMAPNSNEAQRSKNSIDRVNNKMLDIHTKL